MVRKQGVILSNVHLVLDAFLMLLLTGGCVPRNGGPAKRAGNANSVNVPELRTIVWCAKTFDNIYNKSYESPHEYCLVSWELTYPYRFPIPADAARLRLAVCDVAADRSAKRLHRVMLLGILLDSRDKSVRFSAYQALGWMFGERDTLMKFITLDAVVDGRKDIRRYGIERFLEDVRNHPAKYERVGDHVLDRYK